MLKKSINRSRLTGTFIFLGIILSGCFEKKEGCLDVVAANFDAGADKNCCCIYPKLTLDVKHIYDSTNLSLTDVYTNNLGQDFKVLSIAFYISDVQLRSNGEWTPVSNVIEIRDHTGGIHVRPDDVTIINRQTFKFNVGEFLTPGSFDRLRFSIGLKAPEVNTDPESVQDDHPLSSTSSDQLWDPIDGYLSYRISLIDTLQQDTLHWKTPATTMAFVDLEIDLKIDKQIGEDLVIPLEIDYRKWLQSIDIRSDSSEEINLKMRSGMESSITFLQ